MQNCFYPRKILSVRSILSPLKLNTPKIQVQVPPTRRMSSTATMSLKEKIEILRKYSACDVSDALLKLQKLPPGTTPRAGFLADLVPFSPNKPKQNQPKIIAPASTFQFIPKHSPSPSPSSAPSISPLSTLPEHSFHSGKHWVDHSQPNTIAIIQQPPAQYCAALGGIMATRMKILGVKAVIVSGRIRDLNELWELEFPVWAHSTSTVGTGAEAIPATRNLPVYVSGVKVCPGDIVFCDPVDGVVVIPRDLLDGVLEVMPRLVEMDDRVKQAVLGGESVFEAFKKFRTKI